MTKKEKNLSTTTQHKDEQLETGTPCLSYGLDEVSSLEKSQVEILTNWIKHRPTLFETDVPESLIYLMFKITFLNENADDQALQHLKKARTAMKSTLKDSTVQDVQVLLETIASTYSCDVPNELGLNTYWDILKKYPSAFFPIVMLDVLQTYDYPRLPVPKVFCEKFDKLSQHHWEFYYRVDNVIKHLERMLEKS